MCSSAEVRFLFSVFQSRLQQRYLLYSAQKKKYKKQNAHNYVKHFENN